MEDRGWERREALHEAIIEKGDTALDRGPHGHAIIAIKDGAEKRVLIGVHGLADRLGRVEIPGSLRIA